MRSGRLSRSRGPRVPIRIDIEAELGCDDNLAAEGRKALAHEFFVVERAVDLSRVKEGDATLDGGTEKRDCLVLFREGLVAKGHAHASEAEGGDFKIVFPKFAFFHGYHPVQKFLARKVIRTIQR
jgi:hypothetical protein